MSNLYGEQLKEVLVGIQLNNFKEGPDFVMGRWKAHLLSPNKIIVGHQRHMNFQINGNSDEKIVVRTWLSSSKDSIIKIRYYYLQSTDQELANYVVRALVLKLIQKYQLTNSAKFVELNYR